MIDLDALTKKAHDLDPLPPSLRRLAALIGDDDWSFRDVVNIISLDQALTVKLLRLANSAAFARGHVSTVKDAVLRLGAGAVLSLCMGTTVGPQMNVKLPEYGLGEGQLWRHSVAAALAAQFASAYCKVSIPPESFTVALLHDLGKLVLGRFLNKEVLDVMTEARADGLSQLETEVQVLQVHHGEVGALVAQHWGLPQVIWQGISYHHNPEELHHVVCDVVHLSDWIAHQVSLDDEDEEPDTNAPHPQPWFELEAGVKERLALEMDRIDGLRKTVASRVNKVLAQYE